VWKSKLASRDIEKADCFLIHISGEKMKAKSIISLLSLLAILVTVIIWWAIKYDSGLRGYTVLDSLDGRTLLQYADLDINEYWLEIKEKGISEYFVLPSQISQLAPKGYNAKLMKGISDSILINGKATGLLKANKQEIMKKHH
jgi:hypothetical protein